MAIRCGAPLCRLLLLVGFLKLPGACVHLRPRDLLAAELVLGFSHIDSLWLHQLGVVGAASV
jgi:hypothetical protein